MIPLTVIKSALSFSTGGASFVVNNWKLLLKVLAVLMLGLIFIYINHLRTANLKNKHLITYLHNHITELKAEIVAQNNIVEKYNEINKKLLLAQKQSTERSAALLTDLDNLPPSLTDDQVKVLNKRLKCELDNFKNPEINCKT